MISAEEKHGRVSVFSRMVQALSAPVAVVLDNIVAIALIFTGLFTPWEAREIGSKDSRES